ncbi:MAG: tetratricopeptide repeat protein [Albidovulum sp.]|nr:tetratricopeptide repeat protein [Albidovulum sp.]MDE0305616.1 tetratricopeptide repeat protein [Albidovulum sp.]MDE0533662.1 tetratricopeptide repeat protein [Albidovulum sp.]
MFFSTYLLAQTSDLDELFETLQGDDRAAAMEAEQRIYEAWSDSGSPSMNLLLQRGRSAMQAGNFEIAIEHLSALIDHAPDFAEGWNARATAYFYMGEFMLSVSDISQTLARNPRHYGAMSGLGMILEQLGEHEQASAIFGEALELHPHSQGLQRSVERLQRKLYERTY